MPKCDNPFLSLMKRDSAGHFVASVNPEESFWAHVTKTNQCWIWNGTTQNMRYGVFWVRKKRILAHRYSLELVGDKPRRNQVVSHKCDNPLCVKPSHLFIGSQADNLHDMFQKGRGNQSGLELGRGKKGEDSPMHRLTTEQVKEIKSSKDGVMIIAKRYNIAHSSISNIRNGKAWKHIN